MKQRISYMTNLQNENPEEDRFLGEKLSEKGMDVQFFHPVDWKQALYNKPDLVVIRNIWDFWDYMPSVQAMIKGIKDSGVKSYNPITAKAAMQGKMYIPELWQQGLPVVPTVTNVHNIDLLGKQDMYTIKPLWGEDAMGLDFLSASELTDTFAKNPEKLEGMLIQPEIDILTELSFYFISNNGKAELFNATSTNEYPVGHKFVRTQRWDLNHIEPDAQAIYVARQFADWNAMPYGIQRIDLFRTRQGNLLMNEVEDLDPFLSLLNKETPEAARNDFVKKFVDSVNFAIEYKN